MKIINKYKYLFLLAILILAAGLRFYRLSEFPALNADEAALGYNAWSLAQTGTDEHSNLWPIHLQSFNDYKPALYAYILIPFVRVWGLSSSVVRVPGATAGVLSVMIIYLLAKQIVKRAKSDNELFSMLAALFLAISPWHIHFSRGGWEVNLAALFIISGIYLFFKAMNKPKFYIFSFLSFAASLYTYHAARVIVPLLGLGLLVIFYKDNLKNWKAVLVSGIVALVIMIPLVLDLAGPAGLSRAAGVGVFSDPGPLNEINEQRGEHVDLSGSTTKLIHNKPVNYTLEILENWGEHFSGEFLFLSGDDIQRNKVPEHGQMYLHNILFVILGFVAIAKAYNRKWGFVLLWLVVSPVAASLTFQSPHALRAQIMVFPLVLIGAFGMDYLIKWLGGVVRNPIIHKLLLFSLSLVMVWGFLRYQWLYWNHMSRVYPYSSQYGVEEMIHIVSSKYDSYDHILITDRYDQPYILTLFYLEYPPNRFQEEHVLSARDGYGFSTVRNFDKFTFTSIGEWSEVISGYPNSIIVGTDEEVPDEANVVESVYFPNGEVAFKIVAN
ncbi:ArnT family glycosyltransferase [Patescibacteria group bacterium]